MTSIPDRIAGIHLDLKYHMPRKTYLLEWLRRLPEWGINSVLIEYEDKFPFEKYPFIRDPDAFTPAELREFLTVARSAGLICIPLVQSLSHLEFALDHEVLAGLREGPDIPTQICPSNPEAVSFVQDLMAEVLDYHQEDALFHCGGDETWFLGTCPECAAWMARDGIIRMWADHQRKILQPIIEAGRRPLLWDDILWKDFEAIRTLDLPKETVLYAWNYNVTSLRSEDGQPSDAEFGGAAGKLKQIEIYSGAGYDSIAVPCLNYGQLIPRMKSSIGNTRAWAQKAAASGMQGLVNSSWACFHIPLQAQEILVAATGRLCDDPEADVGFAWQQQWLADEFGSPADGVPEALQTLGELWEVGMPDYGRPFTPLVYCYMNMVLHYPGRQDERRRRGAYPVDWDEVDFCEVYRKGVEAVKAGDLEPVFARLDEILEAYPQARNALRALADGATRRQSKAAMLLLFAEMKLLSARIFSHLLRNDGDPEALKTQMLAQREMLKEVLADAFEPVGQDRMLRAWWEPAYRALDAPL